MNDKEMIEEMAKSMCSSYESGKGCKTCPTNWCYADECATMAYYNGYRKIPENAVVLTREEIEHPTRVDAIEFFINHNAKVRKETAREILNEILLIKGADGWQENEQLVEFVNKLANKIEELAKEYGVEIKE